ncbi:hypothetical protein D0Z06_07115 [Geodermatophilus marinus]|nr:hypothetical protein D0Z06_07115 [Geodermatophilus sp. LHW52908]
MITGNTALAQPVPAPALVPQTGAAPCRGCGHGRQAHQHYRRGTDCAHCTCGRYRRSLLARLFSAR